MSGSSTQLWHCTPSVVKTDARLSNVGLHQESVLSPLLIAVS